MTYPPLPTATVIDGRTVYTSADLRSYGRKCYELDRDQPDIPKGVFGNRATTDSGAVDFLMGKFGMKK